MREDRISVSGTVTQMVLLVGFQAEGDNDWQIEEQRDQELFIARL